MNRVLFGVPVLILTFSIGCSAVWYLCFNEAPAETPPADPHQFVVLTKYVPVAAPTPEFRNLDDFDHIAYPELNTNLVDVFEHGSDYRNEELPARLGQTWFALFENNGRAALEKVNVNVSVDRTASEYDEEIWARLAFGRTQKPVFIARRVDGLRPGRVTSVYHRPSADEIGLRNLPIKEMEIGYREGFYLNNDTYLLRVTLGELADGTKANVLVLENNGTSQILTYNPHYDRGDTIGDLLWVGDLDRDGKLDLYFDENSYENESFRSNLFLSSQAERGKLVRLVASFGTAGC